jgi:hypothetical protein
LRYLGSFRLAFIDVQGKRARCAEMAYEELNCSNKMRRFYRRNKCEINKQEKTLAPINFALAALMNNTWLRVIYE